jgi:hypothetical protein
VKSLRHRDGQPESVVDRFGLTFKVDRHEGTTFKVTGPDGQEGTVTMLCDYGYLDGVMGDDGQGWDAYLGHTQDAGDVYVITQVRAHNGHYDEQKGMFGCKSAEEAEDLYRKHTHPTMFGRIGKLSLKSLVEQLAAHRESGAKVFRAETEEDAAELAEMEEAEQAPPSDPEPASE